MRDTELELEGEYEYESQAEPFSFGDIAKGIGSLLGESEGNLESEWETLGEGPLGEGPLGEGSLGEGPSGESDRFLGGLLGESEWEDEGSLGEGPLGEYEGEQFFGGFKKLLKKALPVLKQVAKVAAPIVGGAIGGPIGGKIGSMAANLLGESEYEGALGEAEWESEAEMEAVMEGPLTEQQALGELMAAAASKAVTDMEAEAQIGSSSVIVLSPEDRHALRAVLPALNRGTAVLTRILRRRYETRPMVRVVPTIVKRTAVVLRNRANAGYPITKKAAARAMASQTRKVLATPSICTKAVVRNVKATRAVGQKIRSSSAATPHRRRGGYAM